MQQGKRLMYRKLKDFSWANRKTDMTNQLIVNGEMIKFLPWDYGLEIRTHQKLSLQ